MRFALHSLAMVAAFSLFAHVPAVAQQATASQPSRARSARDFPAARFEPVAQTAAYLAIYDRVAWITTDSLFALLRQDSTLTRQLGAEWFAYERDSVWHAVYGRFDPVADRYIQVAHFAARPGQPFRRQSEPADSLLARRYGRALAVTTARLPAAARESRARFNAYVRPLRAGGLELWYLPAWQLDGLLIHGMEFYYRVDSSGGRVVDSSYFVTPLRGGVPDTTQIVDIFNDAREVPTVGQAFFAYYYGRHFRAVYVHNRDFVTTFLDKAGGRTWIHALRAAPADTTGLEDAPP